MKKLLTLGAGLLLGWTLTAQVTTIPEKIDPNDSLVLIVDLKQMDASIESVQNLVDDATAGLGVFIWTWNPWEFPAGHPKVNGTGSQAWKSSNDTLEMTDMGNLVYKYVFKPTLAEWYETDAATCYARGMSFLVKPKDGGGYGDPDRKSEDINIAIDPPATERAPFWAFPAFPTADDIITVTYESARDTVPGFADYAPGDLHVYVEGRDDAGNPYRLASFIATPTEPRLQMTYIDNGMYRFRFSPRSLLTIPDGVVIDNWRFVLRKGPGVDQYPTPITIDMSCN